MQETIQSFTDYLQTEKKASKNTEVSYPVSYTHLTLPTTSRV